MNEEWDLLAELTRRPDLLREVFRAVEPAYPNEGCGFLFADTSEDLYVLPTENRADKLHAMDPVTYPRGASDWFEPAMKPWFQAERKGHTPVAIFHSHPDVGAYFSKWDHESALLNDADGVVVERHPGLYHLVVSVRSPGHADDAALFHFDPQTVSFRELCRFSESGVRYQKSAQSH